MLQKKFHCSFVISQFVCYVTVCCENVAVCENVTVCENVCLFQHSCVGETVAHTTPAVWWGVKLCFVFLSKIVNVCSPSFYTKNINVCTSTWTWSYNCTIKGLCWNKTWLLWQVFELVVVFFLPERPPLEQRFNYMGMNPPPLLLLSEVVSS